VPELPEVETIRLGLAAHIVGRHIDQVEVLHPRAVRRQAGGAADLVARLRGLTIAEVRRRGKYLWLAVDSGEPADGWAVVIHLGMSGQLLIAEPGAPDQTHLRIRLTLAPDHATAAPIELRFVDQRTFGGWFIDDWAIDDWAVDDSGTIVPESISHIAPDPFESSYDQERVIARIRAKHTEIKRALLDQTLISGVGNIYADEALWRARLHGTRVTDRISRAKLTELLDAVTDVMSEAIVVGGTSFDDLYVNVNGQSGYFERALNAYGREGEPCRRCETIMRRTAFTNRSSFYCPKCQRPQSPTSVR
jgi:formamidopyrimidine-DNA glycosylase